MVVRLISYRLMKVFFFFFKPLGILSEMAHAQGPHCLPVASFKSRQNLGMGNIFVSSIHHDI